MLILAILAFSLTIINLQHHLAQANLTTAQEHSQILNLTHSLAQANASLSQQKAQIFNLTSILNLNKSQVIFNKAISIGPSKPLVTCTISNFSCSYHQPANMTLHFNFTYAGYIVINTTSQNYVFLALTQNYSKTWFGTNSTSITGNLNFSVRSLTMPVLPGPATLRLLYLNTTVPYEAQLTITYRS